MGDSRALRYAGALALAAWLTACSQEPSEPAWSPLDIPQDAEAKLIAELGEETTFITTEPNEFTRANHWICGIASTSGGSRFFVYNAAEKELRVQPATSNDMEQGQALKVLSFMQYREPCSGE